MDILELTAFLNARILNTVVGVWRVIPIVQRKSATQELDVLLVRAHTYVLSMII